MRYTVTIDRDAAADLSAIRDHIANARDLDFADAFVERIVAHCESFAALPHRGTKRDEIRPGLRTVGWRRTVTIAFQISEASRQVTILGIFYRGRDVDSALLKRTS